MIDEKQLTASKAQSMAEQMTNWRRTIHANPELSFHEYGTSRYVASILETVPGLQVETEVAGTGVVAVLGAGSPTILLRADMDALPIDEQTDLPFASRNPGVMHACGHDAHTSIMLGAIHLLADQLEQGKLQGTVKFMFQPAEENVDENGLTGAPHMIAADVLDNVDAAIALHMSPENPVGEVLVHDGYSMANVDNFQGTIVGTGGHGAYPHLGTDPTWLLIPVLQALHGIVARRVSPLEPAVVSIGQIHAGMTNNVIPTEVTVDGTMRSYSPEVRQQLMDEVEKAFSVTQVLGGDYKLDFTLGEPALDNNREVNHHIRSAIESLYPDMLMIDEPFGLGSEDFGHITKRVPGAMFFLGCSKNDGIQRGLHTPLFDIDENCLPIGAAILTETAKRLLAEGPKAGAKAEPANRG